MPPSTFKVQFLPAQLEQLRQLCDLVGQCPTEALEDVAHLADAQDVEIFITGWKSPRLPASILGQFPRTALIAHCAGTAKYFVDDKLFHHGVRVTTAAYANARPVAEYTLAYILRWNKDLGGFEARYRRYQHDYEFSRRQQLSELGNIEKTIGIIAASRVGRCLMRLLRHFDFDVLLHDPHVSEDEAAALGARKVGLEDLLRTSDVVSLNAPLLAETENMIGNRELGLMRDGALLINTGRGRLIDQDALIEELGSGRISAVLDVTHPEPLPKGSPLYRMDNVVLTPHVAGSLGREVHRMTESALSEIDLFIREQRLEHELHADNWSSAA